MTDLIREFLPTAPDAGLYVAPDIPADKLAAAVKDYADGVDARDVVALYDATRLGSAKDGALFLADRLVYQNNNLQRPRTVRYQDLVGVRTERKLLGGVAVEMDVNQGRATVTETLDFSGRPAAAEYVQTLLDRVMLRAAGAELAPPAAGGTDVARVRRALDALRASGHLGDRHYAAILDVLARPA